MSRVTATIAILSIGDMGLGIAKLLRSKNYRVITSAAGRSDYTLQRARGASIELLQSDDDIVKHADYIFSIVPPRDAISIAQRINSALSTLSPARTSRLYYLDLNAISPTTAQRVASILSEHSIIKLIDGGIIGAPPQLTSAPGTNEATWQQPSIPVSGPFQLPIELMSVLNISHISNTIGPASGLKMCFASLTKGLTALALQSFTTAKSMGVFSELQRELKSRAPSLCESANTGVVGCPPKAYRWVREMEEIANTFAQNGHFGDVDQVRGGGLFNSIAEIYRFIAEDTALGKERTEERKIKTTEEVAKECARSLARLEE